MIFKFFKAEVIRRAVSETACRDLEANLLFTKTELSHISET